MAEYLGKLDEQEGEDVYKYNNEILKEAQRSGGLMPPLLLFWKKYQSYPWTVEALGDVQSFIPYDLTVKLLNEYYEHSIENDIFTYLHSPVHNLMIVSSHLFELANGVIVYFLGGMLSPSLDGQNKVEYTIEASELHHVFSGYKIFFLPGKKDFVNKFINSLTFLKYKEIPALSSPASLQMICKNQYGFYLTAIKIKKPIIADIRLHYGDEFEKVHETILAGLKQESAHGLILLHGLPGSGKTHYIRYLIQEITDKQLIYVPPDMTATISSPDFLPFMLQNTNSILIIEDAENIIKTRDSKETTTQAVANLLNLSDGLLGDSLHQPIIATFNCDLNAIDPALLRKGRLISQYEFGKLTIENAQKLSDQLGFTTKISETMILADIYGQESID